MIVHGHLSSSFCWYILFHLILNGRIIYYRVNIVGGDVIVYSHLMKKLDCSPLFDDVSNSDVQNIMWNN